MTKKKTIIHTRKPPRHKLGNIIKNICGLVVFIITALGGGYSIYLKFHAGEKNNHFTSTFSGCENVNDTQIYNVTIVGNAVINTTNNSNNLGIPTNSEPTQSDSSDSKEDNGEDNSQSWVMTSAEPTNVSIRNTLDFNIDLNPALKDVVSLLEKLYTLNDFSHYADVARIGYNYIRPFFMNDSEASVSLNESSIEAISSILFAQILVDWNKGDFDTARQLSKKLLKLRNGLHSGKYTALAREVGISSAEPQPNVLFNYAEALPAQFLTELKNVGNFALGDQHYSDFIYEYFNELSKNGYIYPFVLDTTTYETRPFNLQKYFGFSEPFEPLCNIIQKSERKSGRAIFIAETGTEKKTYDCIVTSRRVGYDRTELTFYLNPTGEEITDPDWNRYKLVSPSPFPLQCKGK